MTTPNFGARGLRNMAVAAAVSLLILMISLPLIALSIDRHERSREGAVVGAEFHQVTIELMERLGSLANWDPALLNLDNHFDAPWAQSNLTSPVRGDIANRLVIVIDGDDRTLFVRERAAPVVSARIAAARMAFAELVARLRAVEHARGVRLPSRTHVTSDWVTGSATMQIQGRPMLVVASLVGPDVGVARQLHSRAPIIVICSDLKADILPGIRSRLLLREAAVTAAAEEGQRAYFRLADANGVLRYAIVWVPEDPGTAMLMSALAPCGVTVVVLLGAILFAYRQAAAGARTLRASEARAHHLALHDGLTGLPNRRMFNDRIQQALSPAASSRPAIALLLIDLDRLKSVNDSYGHQCGDELIQLTAKRLSDVCSAADTCARLGGDEFAILVTNARAGAAAALAERLLSGMAAPAELSAATIKPTVSIGICVSHDLDHNSIDLLREADLALYKAKASGRGSYRFFESEMDQASKDRRLLEEDLRVALAAGDLQVVYQPQFDGDRLVGVEALARWTHPQRGVVPPGLFIPLAEDCGLIAELGAFVMRRSGADARLWPGLQIAVNISARQLHRDGFVQDLAALVKDTGIDPTRFELEITEGVLLNDDRRLVDTLGAIRQMGFSLALDDFGTGYCSLSYLSRFPIDRIKIDRSFISGLPNDASAEAIVRAIIALARSLGIDVLAEGVETLEQKNLLAILGCFLVQGYLTGRPSEPAVITSLFAPHLNGLSQSNFGASVGKNRRDRNYKMLEETSAPYVRPSGSLVNARSTADTNQVEDYRSRTTPMELARR